MARVAVFVDYQNIYYTAREVFGNPAVDPPTFGHIHPLRFGVQLKNLADPNGQLVAVSVYLGKPGPKSGATRQRVFAKQTAAWNSQASVTVRSRPLRYLPSGWSSTGSRTWTAQEKGIDVLLALDVALGATNSSFDLAVVVSGDSDIVPALEVAHAAGKDVHTAMWWSQQDQNRQMNTRPLKLPHHRLDQRRFTHVQDHTDYSI
ncbi:NYN domain-containing protein [Candidatus Poriferisodalis sp.]|uniref:NYN domain-containing protein n=1 Tax=Candidatus Poriferisodalis sp. TaxID=3101277 RepID=UPI003C6EF878